MKLFLIFTTCLAINIAFAQYLSPPSKNVQEVSLKVHNEFRTRHQNTGPLTLVEELNIAAHNCAYLLAQKGFRFDQCSAFREYKPWAVNLFKENVQLDDPIAYVRQAAQSFYDGVKNYNFDKPRLYKGVWEFVDVVWASATGLGVGYSRNAASNLTVVLNVYSPFKGLMENNVHRLK